MAAKPLTSAEKKWLAKLEAVMNECPTKRLACYTIGDNDLMFFDANVAEAWEAANPTQNLDAYDLHEKAGSYLGGVSGSFPIHACAG